MSQVDGGPALPEDEYLTRDQLLELRGVLTEQLDQLLGNSHDAVSNLTSEEETEADTLDIATNASNREFALRLADRERKMLTKIKGALGRMMEGEYGMCEGCGEEITYKRLLARARRDAVHRLQDRGGAARSPGVGLLALAD